MDYALIAGLQDSGSVIGGAVLCLHNVCSLSAQVRKSGVAVGCADGKTVRSLNEDHKRIRVNGVAGWTTSRFDDWVEKSADSRVSRLYMADLRV